MNIERKIVTEIPLNELWDTRSVLDAKRETFLTHEDIGQLLKSQQVTFVVANIGDGLKWISPVDAYSFWKAVGKEHLADNAEHIELNGYPDQYAFIASKWSSRSSPATIVLLERIH